MLNRAEQVDLAKARMDAAAEIGHELASDFDKQRISKRQYGSILTCSCGWASRAKNRPAAAVAEGYWHVLAVLEDNGHPLAVRIPGEPSSVSPKKAAPRPYLST